MNFAPARNYGIIAALAVLATAWRGYNAETFLAPGVELLTVLAVASALLLPRWQAVAVPLVTALAGDLFLGGAGLSSAFVWGAWLLIAAGALLARRLKSKRAILAGGAALGAGSSTVFFLISNFGVWLQGLTGGWSMPGWEGLLATYVMGIPFYLTPAAFNLALVPLAALSVAYLGQRAPEADLEIPTRHASI